MRHRMEMFVKVRKGEHIHSGALQILSWHDALKSLNQIGSSTGGVNDSCIGLSGREETPRGETEGLLKQNQQAG